MNYNDDLDAMIQATNEPKADTPALNLVKPEQSDVKLFERILKLERKADDLKCEYNSINSGTKESSGPFDTTYRHLSLTETLRQEELLKNYKEATTEAKQLRKSLTPDQRRRFYAFEEDSEEVGMGWFALAGVIGFASFIGFFFLSLMVVSVGLALVGGCIFLAYKSDADAKKAFKAKWYPDSEPPKV